MNKCFENEVGDEGCQQQTIDLHRAYLKLKEIIEEQNDEIVHHEKLECKYQAALEAIVKKYRYWNVFNMLGFRMYKISKGALEDD